MVLKCLTWPALLVVAILTTTLRAQTAFTRVLLPIHIGTSQPLSGANGSQFVTVLSVFNANSSDAIIAQDPAACGVGNCAPTVWPANSLASPTGGGVRGAFMNVSAENADLVTFHLRAQDISRQALTWGTELPVVRENDFSGTAINLLNIPLDSRFRQTTRIYDYEGRVTRVRLRVFPMDSARAQVVLAERELDLGPAVPRFGGVLIAPAYAQLGDMKSEFPGIGDEVTVRLEIVPVVPGTLIWAFTSITHNETQHITLVTPK
jgi:hypothetical protein